MRTYVIASGVLFALVFGAHVARVVLEGTGTLRDPLFLGSTVAALAMAGWSAASLRRKHGGAS